jgi:hypothetical protein
MLFCTRCGSCNQEGARFCGNCGAQVSAVTIPNPPRPKHRASKLAKILGVLFLCLVLIVIFAPKARTPDSTQSTPNDTTAEPAQPTAANASASDITLDLSVIGNDRKPILNVRTNLPPKSILMATLVSPILRGGDGYFGQTEGAVQTNQVVQFGPFSNAEDRLSSGIYLVTVTTVMADVQPEEVQPFFGMHGERLRGPQVSILPGTSERLASQKFQFQINPDGSISNLPSNAHTLGLASDAPPPELSQQQMIDAARTAPLPNLDTSPPEVAQEMTQDPGPQTKAFTDCLISKAQNSQYSSFDGGKSAMQLLGDCPDQWKEYVDACMRSGDTDGNCTVKSAVIAQAALKLFNK